MVASKCALMTALLDASYNMNRASYEPTRLQRDALITRIEVRNLYRLTDDGNAFAIYHTKVDNRDLRLLPATAAPATAGRRYAHHRNTHQRRLADARLPAAA